MIHIPALTNPFQGNADHKLNKEGLIQMLRLGIVGELEAIYLYDMHVQATDIEIAKKVLTDIRDEEKAHIDELMTLLHTLNPQEAELLVSDEAEVREMLSELGIAVPRNKSGPGFSAFVTVGSLFDKP